MSNSNVGILMLQIGLSLEFFNLQFEGALRNNYDDMQGFRDRPIGQVCCV